jgi:uncharacterized protein YciI
MPLFAVIGLDHPPHAMDRRDPLRAEHRTYVKDNDAPIRLAAVLVDDDANQCGTLYLFEAANQGQVREWLANEPFVVGDVYRDLVVREVNLAHQMLPLKSWKVVSP